MTTKAAPAPMGEMNTTPLIDVMLVLLIMFIITIPSTTHSVEINLPVDCRDCRLTDPDPVKNKVTITAQDQILWNGTQISQDALGVMLARTTQLSVEPELQFEPDAHASYDASARALNTIKASGVTKFGFVGNERYRNFD